VCAADARSVCDSQVFVIFTNACSVDILYFLPVCMGVDPGGMGGCIPLKNVGYNICYIPPPHQVGLPPAKNTKFVVTTWVLSSSESTKIRFRPLGSLRRSPGPPNRLGRGTPPLHAPPPRRLRRLDLAAIPPSSKRNLLQCQCVTMSVFCFRDIAER